MKISFLYDQGSSKFREDGLFVADPFFGVVDGVSAPYAPKIPMRMFDGMSGGEMVARLTERFVNGLLDYDGRHLYRAPLSFVVSRINSEVGNVQNATNLPLSDADVLAGETFAIARVGERMIELAQAGDCFAVWVMRDGTVGFTENQVRLHDTEMNDGLEQLQREVAAERGIVLGQSMTEEELTPIRGEVWNRFHQVISAARLHDVNNPASHRCYGLLNGQPSLLEVMFQKKLVREEVKSLILFSDGMIPWNVIKNGSDQKVAEMVVEIVGEGGLAKLLTDARQAEEITRANRYTSFAEATAIAIEF